MHKETVEYAIQTWDLLDVYLEDETVLSGDAVAFRDLKHGLRKLCDLVEVSW